MLDDLTRPVFFYGLFMDADVLRSHGVEPGPGQTVSIADHIVRLGAKAMLMPAPGRRAHGVVYMLRPSVVNQLYADLPDYRESPFVAQFATGEAIGVISMVHRDPPIDSQREPGYAAQWTALAHRLGLPTANEESPC